MYTTLASNAIINDKEDNAIKELEYYLNAHLTLLSFLDEDDRETGIAVRKYLYSVLYDQNNHEKPELSDVEKKVYETAYWYLHRLTRDEEGMYLMPSYEAIKSTIHVCFDSYELILLLKSLIKRLGNSLKGKQGGEQKKEKNDTIKIQRDKICEDLERAGIIIKHNGSYMLEIYGVKWVFNYINKKAEDGIYDIEPCRPAYDFIRQNIQDKKGQKIEPPYHYGIKL
jgi:hypothetical protein